MTRESCWVLLLSWNPLTENFQKASKQRNRSVVSFVINPHLSCYQTMQNIIRYKQYRWNFIQQQFYEFDLIMAWSEIWMFNNNMKPMYTNYMNIYVFADNYSNISLHNHDGTHFGWWHSTNFQLKPEGFIKMFEHKKTLFFSNVLNLTDAVLSFIETNNKITKRLAYKWERNSLE